MNNNQLDFYDLLATVVPGGAAVLVSLLSVDLLAADTHLDLAAVSVERLLILTALSYVVGHVVHALALPPARFAERLRWGGRPSEALLTDGRHALRPWQMDLVRRRVLLVTGQDAAPDRFADVAWPVAYESVQGSPSWPRIQKFVALADLTRGVCLVFLLGGIALQVAVFSSDIAGEEKRLLLIGSLAMLLATVPLGFRFLHFTRLVAATTLDAFVIVPPPLPPPPPAI